VPQPCCSEVEGRLTVGEGADHAGSPPDLAHDPLERVVIRYEMLGACSPATLNLKEAYGATIRDEGHREHGGAGRPFLNDEPSARVCFVAAPCDFPGCAVSADQ